MRLWSWGERVSGNVQLKRYFSSAAGQPVVRRGQTSRVRVVLVRASQRVTTPPRLPVPVPLDQTMSGSWGSGVAQPLSLPPTMDHMPRVMSGSSASTPRSLSSGVSAFRPCLLLLGPRVDGPSCRLPYTQYGIRSSTVTWQLCAMVYCTLIQLRPRLTLI